MGSISHRSRTFLLLLAVGACLSCGGGGGGGTIPSTCIAFQSSAAPTPSTAVARQATGSVCGTVIVEIVLTGVTDVFAVDFQVSFDASVASYDGHSFFGSHFISDGAVPQVLESVQPGLVSLSMTRLNPSTGIDFVGTQPVVRLIFSMPAGSGAASGGLSFTNTSVLGSETPPQPKPGIQWFGGTLQIG